MLDNDLAALYGVSTKRFNEQIMRNKRRFPPDFMFKMTRGEYQNLRSQIATSRQTHGGRRYLPNLFTEHGAIMAASVLNSLNAIEMSIFVVRAFVRLREILSTHRQLAAKLSELERKLSTHDEQIVVLFEAIRQLMEEPVPEKRRIGFGVEDVKDD
jgi:hypothetical protein